MPLSDFRSITASFQYKATTIFEVFPAITMVITLCEQELSILYDILSKGHTRYKITAFLHLTKQTSYTYSNNRIEGSLDVLDVSH